MTAGTLSTENWQNIATKVNLSTNRKDHYENGGQAKKRSCFWKIHGRLVGQLLIFCVGLQDPVAKGTDRPADSTRVDGDCDVSGEGLSHLPRNFLDNSAKIDCIIRNR